MKTEPLTHPGQGRADTHARHDANRALMVAGLAILALILVIAKAWA